MINRILKNITAVFILLNIFMTVASAVPSFVDVKGSYKKSDVALLDRRGRPLYNIRTDMMARRLGWISLADISPALINAVIYAEDKRFYSHSGVDYLSIAGVVADRIIPGSDKRDSGTSGIGIRGASTITMQLASMLNPELQPGKSRRTVSQKISQMKEGRRIEKQWTKEEILEAYLNLITFRGELQGIDAASRGLFGKVPHGLNHAESLILASLIRSPNASKADITKRASLLGKSLKWKMPDNELKSAVYSMSSGSNVLILSFGLAPHAARLLISRNSRKSVTCTIDGRLQQAAMESLRSHLDMLDGQNVGNGAVLVAENKTGNILAYVSYTNDDSEGYYVDGIMAKRQAGSTLKPFLYGLAFENKILTPASVIDDSPVDIPVFSGIYRPQNYDSDFKGYVTARVGLASSLNIPAVRVLSLTGIEQFLARLRMLGINGLDESGDFYGPSLALGSADVTLWELVGAYRCLANGGMYGELSLVPDGGRRKKKRIYSGDAAYLVSDILSDREARSATFGLENPLATKYRTSVKTGTSKDMRDNWCIGYSDKYTAGVWVGNFTGEPMWDVSGISGAAPVWNDIMNYLHADNTKGKQVKQITGNIIKKPVNFSGGDVPSKEESFIKGTEPAENRITGQLNLKIIYPPSGTIIALDPDIPPDLQKVFFLSQPGSESSSWVLNEKPVDERCAGRACWSPEPGYHLLALIDENGIVSDSVTFEVRGE